jgi:hypothetical protein
MKATLFLVLMSVCTTSMAQESDSCEIYTEDNIITLFDNQRWGKTAVDTSYYHNFFYVPNKAKLQAMGEWARQQGYAVVEKVIDENAGDRSHMIILEKQIMHEARQQMVQEIQSIVAKRKELDIFKCKGTGLGGGKSFMSFVKPSN